MKCAVAVGAGDLVHPADWRMPDKEAQVAAPAQGAHAGVTVIGGSAAGLRVHGESMILILVPEANLIGVRICENRDAARV